MAIQWQEAAILPEACRGCMEDCGNCDYAGARWTLTEREALLAAKKGKLVAIARLQRQIAEIDEKLRRQ